MGKERIKQEGIYILNYLGTIENSDYANRNSLCCVYKKRRLEILANNLKFANNNREIKKSIRNIMIKYDDKVVFSSKTGFYIPGIWEEKIHIISGKIPSILEIEKNKQERIKRGNFIFHKLFDESKYNYQIGENIEVKYKEKDFYSQKSDVWSTIRVLYKKRLVMEASKIGQFGEYKVTEYYPGDWEIELINEVELREQRKKERERQQINYKRLERYKNL